MNRSGDCLIAPSLLSADFARLADECRRAEEAGADWHHVDVMDGHFVPNLTIGPVVVAALRRVVRRPLDVHLMIEDPWSYADAFLEAGAAGLTVHVEVLGRGDGRDLLRWIRRSGARAGVALNPKTPLEELRPYLDSLDMVLVMSVQPGFAGQRFMPEVLVKTKELRDQGFDGDLQMDGGLSRDNVADCARAGCNVFVAGSALYKQADMAQEIAEFRRRIAAAGGGGEPGRGAAGG